MYFKATRARSRLEELTFGTFNVRTAAVNGVKGIGHIDTLLRTVLRRVVTSSYCRRSNGTELPKFLHLDTAFLLVVIAASLGQERAAWGWTGGNGEDR